MVKIDQMKANQLFRKTLTVSLIVFGVSILFSSCASQKKGCPGAITSIKSEKAS